MICRPDGRPGLFALAAVLGLAALSAPGPVAPAAARSTAAPASAGPPAAVRSAEALAMVQAGRQHYRAGDHRRALAASIRAVELDPSLPEALQFRGHLLRDSRGPVAALPWFERALQRRPDDLDLLNDHAATLAEAGRHRDMLAVARRMVEIDPGDPRAYFLQAVLAARSGHDDLARRLLARTGNAVDTAGARLLAALLELRAGNAVLAADAFEGLVRQQPDNQAAAVLLGRALLAANDPREAVARLAPLADRADASPYLLTLVGRAHEQLGDRASAARYLDRAADRPPPRLAVLAAPGGDTAGQGAGAVVLQVRRLLATGRSGAALALAGDATRRYPGSADVQRLAGDTALLAGDPRQALAHYAQAAEIRRDFALVERLVTVLRLTGQQREALGLLTDYIALNPRDLAGPRLLGRLLAQQGSAANASALLALAGRLGGDHDPLLLADRATLSLMLGEPDGAVALALRAQALQPSHRWTTTVLTRAIAARGAAEETASPPTKETTG